ncbi:MAG: DUF882 domain-containing protein [Deltaproteobacteria bacterium]|nr:MAG: DUF882 domain-containing protein [Deltaproteobacteria bacterium]
MTWTKLAAAAAFAVATVVAEASPAEARPAQRAASAAPAQRAARRTTRARRARRGVRECRRVRGHRRCRWVPVFAGHGVAASRLRTEPLPKPSGDIHLWLVNFREDVAVHIYRDDGSLDDEALAALDHAFRCKRTREERAVDPRLYEVLSIIYDHFGRRRIELVSGFRFQRNEKSRHFHASAMDIRIPGVSPRKLYEFAESLDTGGMGIGLYPRAGFVHIDFRAPGAKSYRWVDRSPPGGSGPDKAPSRKWHRKRRRPTS